MNWPYVCKTCGMTYTPDEWEDAKYVGVSGMFSDTSETEFRICTSCATSMSQNCPSDFINVKEKTNRK